MSLPRWCLLPGITFFPLGAPWKLPFLLSQTAQDPSLPWVLWSLCVVYVALNPLKCNSVVYKSICPESGWRSLITLRFYIPLLPACSSDLRKSRSTQGMKGVGDLGLWTVRLIWVILWHLESLCGHVYHGGGWRYERRRNEWSFLKKSCVHNFVTWTLKMELREGGESQCTLFKPLL